MQSVPAKIFFENQKDFLTFIDKNIEFLKFRETVTLIDANLPELEPWVHQYPSKVVTHQNEWDGLIKVCRYFMKNPRPNLYIRELPIDVHTKFSRILNNYFLTEIYLPNQRV